MFRVVAVAKADKALMEKLITLGKDLQTESDIVAGKTARRGVNLAAKEIQEDLGGHGIINQKDIRKEISYSRITKGTYRIQIKKSDRLQLSRFNSRQTKAGVTYKMQGERRLVPHAFMYNSYKQKVKPPKLQGGAWKRKPNAPRAGIVQLFGPSPFAVINPKIGNDKRWKSLKTKIESAFRVQIMRRINTLVYRASKG